MTEDRWKFVVGVGLPAVAWAVLQGPNAVLAFIGGVVAAVATAFWITDDE